jgi:predicted NBD/HSP70 family sugar kinase
MNERSRGVELLTLVHREPGISRADAARRLGMTTGQTTEVTARLVAADLVQEIPATPSGSRGRPSMLLSPHPEGPLALCAAIDHESWHVAVVGLGCAVVEEHAAEHDRQADSTLAAVARAVSALRRSYGGRVRATAVSIPGTVRGDLVLQAAPLGWTDVSLRSLRPRRSVAPFLVGNDASLAAVAEARRGAGVGSSSLLHLYFDAGLGGAIVEGGRLVNGASGVAGEFGHLPFGDPSLLCRCGAYGCWNTAVDGSAFATLLGRRTPRAEFSFVTGVLAAARRGDPDAVRAVERVAAEVGRGAAGLVNALDPAIITFGGYGEQLLELAFPALHAAYESGLMLFRRKDPPLLAGAVLGRRAPLLGAAEECFDRLLTAAELTAWSERTPA